MITNHTAYPTGGEYREALFNTQLCFKDAALIGGTVELDSLGMPKPISGAFASVFTMPGSDGRRWALKCFTRFVEDQARRYDRVSSALATVTAGWRVGFDYQAVGILVSGTWYPLLKMEWVDARGLIPFIEDNLHQPQAMADLANRFADLVLNLASLGIAHGDLQHGNLLVTPSGDLKLIDYDGMYLPDLYHLGAIEIGHSNYQSPGRTLSSWGPYLDNFSAWIIYVSLIALAVDPMLWTYLHASGDEALLFHKDDFMDPRNSRTLVALRHSSDTRLQSLGDALSPLWTSDLTSIPRLDPAILAGTDRRQLPVSLLPGAINTTSGSPPSSTQGLPNWITERQGDEISCSVAPSDSTWIAAHIPASPPVIFSPANARQRLLTSLWLLTACCLGALTAAGLVPFLAGWSLCAFFAVSYYLLSLIAYLRTAEYQLKRKAHLRERTLHQQSLEAEKRVESFERQLRDIAQHQGL